MSRGSLKISLQFWESSLRFCSRVLLRVNFLLACPNIALLLAHYTCFRKRFYNSSCHSCASLLCKFSGNVMTLNVSFNRIIMLFFHETKQLMTLVLTFSTRNVNIWNTLLTYWCEMESKKNYFKSSVYFS